MQESRVQYLGWEEPLAKEMAIHSSILAWRIPWTLKELGGLRSVGLQRVGHDGVSNTCVRTRAHTHTHTHTHTRARAHASLQVLGKSAFLRKFLFSSEVSTHFSTPRLETMFFYYSSSVLAFFSFLSLLPSSVLTSKNCWHGTRLCDISGELIVFYYA